MSPPLVVGYHCSHEQWKPSALLRHLQRAEQAGFGAGMCSDHFHPWSERQGQSGFAWAWLGAALQATRLDMGTVCAPGQRYHPAIVARAVATLADMNPGRVWVALGSGEALNEAITGDRWPEKAERDARLRECVDIIRALWAGETVTHKGLVSVREARLFTRPDAPPRIIGPALTVDGARSVAAWADGFVTAGHDAALLRPLVEAFREAGGSDKPLFLQAAIAYDPQADVALRLAHEQWRQGTLSGAQLGDTPTPWAFDALVADAPVDAIRKATLVVTDVKALADWMQEMHGLGFERVYLHDVTRRPEAFIDACERVLFPRV
jgi:coenzyme F420-dependent glucose-6-phosphate dehydrogenase